MRPPPWWIHWCAVAFSLWWGIQFLVGYRPEPDGFFWLGLPSWLTGGVFTGTGVLAAAGLLLWNREAIRWPWLFLAFIPQQALLVSVGVSMIQLYLTSASPGLMMAMAWAVLIPVFYTIAMVRYTTERLTWRFTRFPWRR